jgi:hypothetical protein
MKSSSFATGRRAMNDPAALVAAASAGTVAIGIASAALLRAWSGWIELRRQQLAGGAVPRRPQERTELASLKERVKRLEAIASGVDF